MEVLDKRFSRYSDLKVIPRRRSGEDKIMKIIKKKRKKQFSMLFHGLVKEVTVETVKTTGFRVFGFFKKPKMNYIYETLSVAVEDKVAFVNLNRPEKLNAMNTLFWAEMRLLFTKISKDTSIRAVVLSANGKHFTAGLDLMDISLITTDQNKDQARTAMQFISMVDSMQESFSVIERCSQPVIVCVHGACIGGGIDLITACDIRFCTKDSKFSVKEVDIGLAADIGTLQRLPKVVGSSSWVRDVCLSARGFNGQEAHSVGLCSRIFDTREQMYAEGSKFAKILASKSPVAIVGTKHILNHSRDHTVSDGLKYVGLWNSVMIRTDDVGVAVSSTLSKTIPKFSKL